MITGVGLFSTFSGTVAAVLLKANQSGAPNDTLLQELRALLSEVERLFRTGAQTDIQEDKDYEKSLRGIHIDRSGNRFQGMSESLASGIPITRK
jgi:hypothetical protein